MKNWILDILKKKFVNQFIKFCFVGVVNTAIDFGILNLGVIVFKWNIYLAATIAFIIAASNSFLMNKYWTFTEKSKGMRFATQYFQFLMVSTGGLLLNLGIMYIFIEGAGLWYNWAKVFATAIVIMWNFGLNKYWTFRTANVKIASKTDDMEIRNTEFEIRK